MYKLLNFQWDSHLIDIKLHRISLHLILIDVPVAFASTANVVLEVIYCIEFIEVRIQQISLHFYNVDCNRL